MNFNLELLGQNLINFKLKFNGNYECKFNGAVNFLIFKKHKN